MSNYAIPYQTMSFLGIGEVEAYTIGETLMEVWGILVERVRKCVARTIRPHRFAVVPPDRLHFFCRFYFVKSRQMASPIFSHERTQRGGAARTGARPSWPQHAAGRRCVRNNLNPRKQHERGGQDGRAPVRPNNLAAREDVDA